MIDGFRTNVQRYAALGLDVEVTEIDIKNNEMIGNTYFREACLRNTVIYRDVVPPVLILAGMFWQKLDWYYITAASLGLVYNRYRTCNYAWTTANLET